MRQTWGGAGWGAVIRPGCDDLGRMELVPQWAESGGQLVRAGKSQIGIRRATPARFSREGRNHVGHATREYPSTQTGAPVQDLTKPIHLQTTIHFSVSSETRAGTGGSPRNKTDRGGLRVDQTEPGGQRRNNSDSDGTGRDVKHQRNHFITRSDACMCSTSLELCSSSQPTAPLESPHTRSFQFQVIRSQSHLAIHFSPSRKPCSLQTPQRPDSGRRVGRCYSDQRRRPSDDLPPPRLTVITPRPHGN